MIREYPRGKLLWRALERQIIALTFFPLVTVYTHMWDSIPNVISDNTFTSSRCVSLNDDFIRTDESHSYICLYFTRIGKICLDSILV